MKDLRRIRLAKGYTVTWCAKQVGARRAAWGAWESGRASMPVKFVRAVAQLLGMNEPTLVRDCCSADVNIAFTLGVQNSPAQDVMAEVARLAATVVRRPANER